MKKMLVVVALGMGLAGCQGQTATQQRVTTGAGVGALGGAAVGALAGGGRGAAIGAVAGGIGGAAVAGATAPRNCTAYDSYGRPYAVVCP
ncbi:bacteriocin [Chthonobacter rhizosphaerae]|uniref:bacteriocin n=1 Tax=Chthonobacter rhizosphaerae TaxID=2735553 RepID=UPI0015EF777C|nr:bacteriocin [Chthonobacter rhizosphaerae]